MGKKTYVTPMAVEEAFVANCYVAKCQLNISSTSTQNKMRCIIPWHDDYNEYFTSVWLDATSSNCEVKVTRESTKTNTDGNAFHPTSGATVYGADGTTYTCNVEYTTTSWGKEEHHGYYLPWANGTSNVPCVGSYVNTGTYEEISSKVFS